MPQIDNSTNNQMMAQEVGRMSMNDIKNQVFNKNRIPPHLAKFIDMDNIAENLKDEYLKEIANVLNDGFEIDKNSRNEWIVQMENAFELLSYESESKSYPWDKASNIKHPMLLSACMQFNARITPEIIKGDKVVKSKSFIPDTANHDVSNREDRISSHMSYQLLCDESNWQQDTDKLMMILPLVGTVYRKSYFNNINGRPETEICLPESIIINNNIKCLESAQRITHVIYLTSNELIENMRRGLYKEYSLSELTDSTSQLSLDFSNENSNEQVRSFSTNEDEKENVYDKLHTIYEQHRYLDLDGDGYQEPYIVTLHEASGKVLRIVARYDESSFEYNEHGKFIKINPIHYFTDYHFVPNPNGSFHSLGYGYLLFVLNHSANTITNQLIDAGTLSNRQSGFIGSGLRLPKGDLNFRPGEWKQVDNTMGANISQSIVPLPIKEPSQTLFQLLNFLIDSSKAITSIADVMAGSLPPANTPAATVMALVEQGQQVYSSILLRVYSSLKKEFGKLYNINRKYLADEECFPLASGLGMIRQEDYMAPNYGIYPVADPKLSSSMERMMQGQELLQLMQYPEIDKRRVLANYLEILKVKDIESYMPPPDPNPPPTPAEELAHAQMRNINMDTACKLAEKELKAIELGIKELENRSKAAYYGGQLAGDKIDSIAKLAELEQIVPEQQIAKATQEEEALTEATQAQNVPGPFYERIENLENMLNQMLGTIQQQQTPGGAPEGEVGQQMEAPQMSAPQEMLQEGMPEEGM